MTGSTARPDAPALVLASASSGRLTTLRRAGFVPVVEVSEVDEDAVLRELAAERLVSGAVIETPRGDGTVAVTLPADAVPAADQVLALARAKAREVVSRCGERLTADHPAGVVLVGCDSMLETVLPDPFAGGAPDDAPRDDGAGRRVVVGKPGTPERAAARWRAQRGTGAVLVSGHWVVRLGDGEPREAGATSLATIRFADVDDAEIDAYVATGEPLHAAGAFTIDGYGAQFVDGIDGDPHGVVGISLPLLRELTSRVGVRLSDLWA